MMNINSGFYRQKLNIQNKNQQKLAFGRALTTAETNLLNQALPVGYQKAGIDFCAVIMPVAAAPTEDKSQNTGIGTFLGLSKFLSKLAPLTGINAAQLLPTGKLSGETIPNTDVKNWSPFSTPSFGLYEGYIEPSELTKKEYGSLLSEKDIHSKNFPILEQNRNNYENIDQIETLLNKAYKKYESKKETKDPSVIKLTKEFDKFKEKEEIKYWLNTYAENFDSENPERYKFKQFIAAKQYEEMQKRNEELGIKIITDCPISVSELDGKVASKNNNGDNPFLDENYRVSACNDRGEDVSRWGPVLNPLSNAAQSLEYQKGLYYAKLSNGGGVRGDAFNNYIAPSITRHEGDGVDICHDYRRENDSYATELANAFLWGLNKGGVAKGEDNSMYLSPIEHLPPAYKYDKKRVDFINSYIDGNNQEHFKLPRFSPRRPGWGLPNGENFWDFYSNHDLSNIHNDKNCNSEAVKNEFVGLFLNPARKYQLMFTDIIGTPDSYNSGGKVDKNNWSLRLSQNWESNYHTKLQEGLGFNAPETLDRVLNWKNISDDKTDKLKGVLWKLGQILRENGVTTEKDANKKFGETYVDPELKKLI